MRYRTLPVVTELETIQREQGDEAMQKRREALFLQVAALPGFQLVTGILREYEKASLDYLRTGTLEVAQHMGRLALIENIRSSLTALLPAEQRPSVDWFDDAEEEFTGFVEAAGRE